MIREIKQFKYNSADKDKWKSGIEFYPDSYISKTEKDFNEVINKANDNALANDWHILQLGIQTFPGAIFYLNGVSLNNAIRVGSTGIFEISVTNQMRISKLQFDERSLSTLDSNPTTALIVDMLIEREEAN